MAVEIPTAHCYWRLPTQTFKKILIKVNLKWSCFDSQNHKALLSASWTISVQLNLCCLWGIIRSHSVCPVSKKNVHFTQPQYYCFVWILQHITDCVIWKFYCFKTGPKSTERDSLKQSELHKAQWKEDVYGHSPTP